MSFYTNVKVVGDYIFLRGVDGEGKRYDKKLKYSPVHFVPTKEKTKYTTLDGRHVAPMKFETMKEARNFIEQYKDVDNFPIYGYDRYETTFIGDEYPGEIDYDFSKLVVANIDIEVASDEGFPDPKFASSPIISIAVKFNDKFLVFGYGEPDGCNIADTLAARGIDYISCEDELDLLDRFIRAWSSVYPDIVTGWNVNGFDIPYIINRITRVKSEKEARKISPWKHYISRTFTGKYGAEVTNYLISGISVLDYIELYQKFTYVNRESYRLDYIANVELGERKLSYSEFGSLHTLYKRDYHKFIEYNVKDVELVERLEDKMKLIEMAIALAYSAKVNFDDVFSQVRMWENICYHHLRKTDRVFPPREAASKTSQFEGAYVKEPQVGFHKWVVSFDLNSLYPHLMIQYNISPEKLVPEEKVNKDVQKLADSVEGVAELIDKKYDTSILKEHGLSVLPNGVIFDINEAGFLPEIIDEKYNNRTISKKRMIESQKLLERIETEIARRKSE